MKSKDQSGARDSRWTLEGIVNEASAPSPSRQGDGCLNGTVESVVNDAFEVADPDAPVGLFNHIFNQGKVVVVWERGEVRGLITQIDVIDFLAHRRRAE